jgi:hypothetical protein
MITLTVYVGKFKLSSDPTGISEHWALGFKLLDETFVWFEVKGASKEATGSPNEIVRQDDSATSKYTEKEEVGVFTFEGDLVEFEDYMKTYNEDWVKVHKLYKFNGDNCQLYVKGFLDKYEIRKLETQNSQIGNLVIGAGIGSSIVGVAAILAGFYLKGNH